MSPRRGEPVTTARTVAGARDYYARLCARLPEPPLWQLALANQEWMLALEAEKLNRGRQSTYVRRERK